MRRLLQEVIPGRKFSEIVAAGEWRDRPEHVCRVKGCPSDGTAGIDDFWLCHYHWRAWGRFLESYKARTGKDVRVGKYGNWHIRFREFLEWAERHPKDCNVFPC